MTLKRINILTMLFVCMYITTSYAQQDSQYTQYIYNTEIINPAYAGTRKSFVITSLSRTQWAGIDGAPRTITFSANSSFGERVGLGLSFIKDKIGPSDENTLALDFSYIIPIGANLNLALGAKGGVNFLNVDLSLLNIKDPTDTEFLQYNIGKTLTSTPIVGAGLYLYNDIWYVGVSVPSLLETTHFDDASTSNVSKKQNFYGIAGYVFTLNDNIKFKPALLGKLVSGAPISLDLSTNFLFNDKFTMGVGYRFGATISALASFQVSDNLMIGYSYDYATTAINDYSSGSHEIFLRFEIFKSSRSINPRFF